MLCIPRLSEIVSCRLPHLNWITKNLKMRIRCSKAFCLLTESWSLKCELLFVFFFLGGGGREGFQVKLILFVSLGVCKLLRWPLRAQCLVRHHRLHVYTWVIKDEGHQWWWSRVEINLMLNIVIFNVWVDAKTSDFKHKVDGKGERKGERQMGLEVKLWQKWEKSPNAPTRNRTVVSSAHVNDAYVVKRRQNG